MAEKAVVMSVTDIQRIDGVWHLTVAARVTMNNEGGSVEILATATSSTFVPLLPNWRSRVSDAVVAAASTLQSLEVDQVLFGDFGVLGT